MTSRGWLPMKDTDTAKGDRVYPFDKYRARTAGSQEVRR